MSSNRELITDSAVASMKDSDKMYFVNPLNILGEVNKTTEQMVFSEATAALTLIAGVAYDKGNWRDVWRQAAYLRNTTRTCLSQPHRLTQLFTKAQPKVATV